jgi:hypothetical protein
MITIDQATKEINANEFTLAKMIAEAERGGDPAAKRIINAYDGAINQKSQAAEAEFLELYDAWRDSNVAAVMPIAAALGHEPPGGSNGAASPFAVQPAPAPSQSSPVEAAPVVQAAPEPTGEAKTAPAAQEAAKTRTRRGWSQSDIVKLTRALMLAAEAEKPSIVEKLAGEFGRPAAEVSAKAVELELLPAPPSIAPYTLSDTDKNVLRKRLLEVVKGDLSVDVKLAQFKFVATEAREIVKEISG